MKVLSIAFVWIMIASSAVNASMFSLKCIKLPLWYNGEGEEGIQLISVPKVRMSTPGEWQMIELFDDPFEQYDPRIPKTSSLRRIEDINMIHAYGITTSAVYGRPTDPDKPLRLVIDISKAEMSCSFSIMEVAQATATCIRELFPKNPDVPLMLKTKDGEVLFEPPFAPGRDVKKDGAEKTAAGQPSTCPVVEPKGSDKPQPDSEGRSR